MDEQGYLSYIEFYLEQTWFLLTETDKIDFSLDDKYIFASWTVHFHDSLTLPQSNEFNMYKIDKKTFNLLTWKLSSFRLLESPYQTNCKDYGLSGQYLSRKDCIRKCKLRVSIDECGVVFKGIDIERGESPVIFGRNSNQSEQACFNKLNYTNICTKSCPHYDCAINYYQPIVLHQSIRNNRPDTLLQIIIPYKPETSYHHQAKFKLVEFICLHCFDFQPLVRGFNVSLLSFV